MRRLKEIGFAGEFIIECEISGEQQARDILETVKYLQELREESRSIFAYQNEVFLKQVKSGDWSNNPSDYSDGLKTLHLTLACDRALSQGLVKV